MVRNKTKVSDHIYDLRVKGQGHIYLKSVLQLLKQLFLHFLMDESYSWHNGYFTCVDGNQYFRLLIFA